MSNFNNISIVTTEFPHFLTRFDVHMFAIFVFPLLAFSIMFVLGDKWKTQTQTKRLFDNSKHQNLIIDIGYQGEGRGRKLIETEDWSAQFDPIDYCLSTMVTSATALPNKKS
jgi:hypothetical protein